MAVKKSELYSSLWQSCDQLRGGMDASQYKDYVLTLLFVKYVSDKYAHDPYGLIQVPEGGSFEDMQELKGDKEIGDEMNKIVGALAEANELKGVIDLADFNDEDKLGDGKAMVDRLSNLVTIFEGLDLRANRVGGDDLLGDAYEYLMRHFATESGKSKGQFYTPAEVSRVLAQVLQVPKEVPASTSVYDPTCGSGSLLLKVAGEAGGDLSLFGQEMDHTTHALARMNMILHGNAAADVRRGNTLASPHWTESGGGANGRAAANGASGDGSAASSSTGTPKIPLKRFDFAVANPPFSYKSWSNGFKPEDDPHGRFGDPYGTPPSRNGDYAFLLHIVASLKRQGRAAVILPHGVLFRGNAEADIRRALLRRGLVKGIIGLPPNLFYGTGIPACIVVLDKGQAQPAGGLFGRNGSGGDGHAAPGVFMIDASRGFRKDGNKNRLRERDIHKIVDVFTTEAEEEGYARRVPLDEIEANDYNLNIPRYIDATEEEDIHDLDAHMQGGIPHRDLDDLEDFWEVFPNLRADLFEPVREGYSEARVPARAVKETILEHPDFRAFGEEVDERRQAWRAAHEPRLRDLEVGADPKALIEVLSEDLLARFEGAPLIDRYAVYQRLMDFWNETMQDDVFVIAQDGWAAGQTVRPAYENEPADFEIKKGRKKVGYVGELIPARLVIAAYFPEAQAALDALEGERQEAEQRLEEFEEEHTGEGGALDGLESSRGVSKGNVADQVQTLKEEALEAYGEGTPEREKAYAITKSRFGTQAWEAGTEDREGFFPELDVLHGFLRRYADRKQAKSAVKDARADLYAQVVEKYPALSEAEIKTLVVEKKWLAAVEDAVRAEIERVTRRLAGRIETLEERYADPLPALEEETAALSNDVDSHLETMGVAWQQG